MMSNNDRLAISLLCLCGLMILLRFCFFYPADWRLLLNWATHNSGSTTLLFFAWNLFLAALPYGVARLLRPGQSAITTSVLLVIWLLLLPNAPYLVSDLIHLRPRPPVPYVYDIITFSLCAGTGLLLGGLAILEAIKHLDWTGWDPRKKILSLSLFPAVGFGIYLGRVLRWNSWDALLRPVDILADITRIVSHPPLLAQLMTYTICYGLLLGVSTVVLLRLARYDFLD